MASDFDYGHGILVIGHEVIRYAVRLQPAQQDLDMPLKPPKLVVIEATKMQNAHLPPPAEFFDSTPRQSVIIMAVVARLPQKAGWRQGHNSAFCLPWGPDRAAGGGHQAS